MERDVEQILVRELREVADGVEIPALPPGPAERRPRPGWQPLLVAAAVVLVVLGAAAVLSWVSGGSDIQPAPAPRPTAATHHTAEADAVPTSPPTVPYVLGTRLYVAGERVPGDWAHVEGTGTGWVAVRSDGTYWWGNDATPRSLPGRMNQPPAVSPDGRYLARIVDAGGEGVLTALDLESGGERLGSVPVDLVDRDGVSTSVAAVTDDGLVVTRGNGTSLLWRPLGDGRTVDLSATAPDQAVVGGTAAGLVVVDGADAAADARQGQTYLADISADGRITHRRPVPNHDDLVAADAWLAWVPPGTLGGEVGAVDGLDVRRLDGSGAGTLTPPAGWAFRAMSWTWEDGDHLVAAVVKDGEERMVRCSPAAQSCVLLDTP